MLIDANTPVPCDRTRTFATATDDQTEVQVRVVAGRAASASPRTRASESFELTGIAPRPRGEQTQIAVTFEIDADGILNVRAKNVATGRRRRPASSSSARRTTRTSKRCGDGRRAQPLAPLAPLAVEPDGEAEALSVFLQSLEKKSYYDILRVRARRRRRRGQDARSTSSRCSTTPTATWTRRREVAGSRRRSTSAVSRRTAACRASRCASATTAPSVAASCGSSPHGLHRPASPGAADARDDRAHAARQAARR